MTEHEVFMKIMQYTDISLNRLTKLRISYSCSPMEKEYLEFLEKLVLDLEKFHNLNVTGKNINNKSLVSCFEDK